MTKGKLLISGLVAAALAAGAGYWLWKKDGAEVKYRTAAAERGSIQISVTATGTLQALVTVQVGTQVSGPIASIHADFNSEVKKGQVIARLDTTLLTAALQDARSSFARVAAQNKQAADELKRTKALFERALISQAELDQAEASAQVAAANLNSAQSQVERARINLRYATITSPIDGIVLSRAVDVGQTVAASFNTPTLFTIAGDLREMEVKAAVDEADIGKVQAGQKATFTVDAYPEAVFAGSVQQVRLEPKVVQNVVTYDVVIRVPNPDKKLMPGMTANLTIAVTEKDDVLLVPAAALRFRPPRDASDTGKSGGRWGGKREGGNHGGGESESARDQKTAGAALGRDSAGTSDSGGMRQGRGGSDGRGGRGDGSTGEGPPGRMGREGGGSGGQRGRVFLLVDGKPAPVRVKIGLSDGSRTEIEGPVEPGAQVLIGIEGPASAASGAARPFGMQPGAAGGRRRGM